MANFTDLEQRIEKIESRNTRVEKEKAWETSWTRKLAIIVSTYIIMATYFAFVLHVDPWINAIVPTTGFFLSTLSLPLFKDFWSKYIYKK